MAFSTTEGGQNQHYEGVNPSAADAKEDAMKITQGLAALALVALLAPDVALAANPGFCQHYAGVAVRQYHQAIEHGCIGGPDLRWNANWNGTAVGSPRFYGVSPARS